MILLEDERLEDLEYKGIKIIQREGYYRFTSDSVLLSNLADIRKGSKVLDMGTGSGIIAILIAVKKDVSKVIGIEIQDVMADMAERSVQFNNLSDKIEIIKSDIKDAPGYFGHGSFDYVVVNPPYGKPDSGEISGVEHIDISKKELKITLEEIIESASKVLKYGGKMSIINKADRLAEIISLMVKYNLIPKKLINIMPKADKSVDTVVVEAKKGAKHGMTIDTLIVYNQDNTMTKESAKLYNKETQ